MNQEQFNYQNNDNSNDDTVFPADLSEQVTPGMTQEQIKRSYNIELILRGS